MTFEKLIINTERKNIGKVKLAGRQLKDELPSAKGQSNEQEITTPEAGSSRPVAYKHSRLAAIEAGLIKQAITIGLN